MFKDGATHRIFPLFYDIHGVYGGGGGGGGGGGVKTQHSEKRYRASKV